MTDRLSDRHLAEVVAHPLNHDEAALAREVLAWRASGLTPEQAQRVGPVLLGRECPMCEGRGRTYCPVTVNHATPGTETCPDCHGTGRTPSLAERLADEYDNDLAGEGVALVIDDLRKALA